MKTSLFSFRFSVVWAGILTVFVAISENAQAIDFGKFISQAAEEKVPVDFGNDGWNRVYATKSALKDYAPQVYETIQAIADVQNNRQHFTAIYVGMWQGQMLMLANRHSLPSQEHFIKNNKCIVGFSFTKVHAECDELVYINPDLDMVLFTIKHFRTQDMIEDHPVKFASREEIVLNRPLITAGYGVYQNKLKKIDGVDLRNQTISGNRMTMDASSECRITESEPFVITDRTGDFHALSIGHRCETSEGDSGSPIIDRETGKVMGMAWSTLYIFKNKKPKEGQEDLQAEQKRRSNHAIPGWALSEAIQNFILNN